MKKLTLSNGEIRNAFEYAELSKEAQANVLKYFINNNDTMWFDDIREDAKQVHMEISEMDVYQSANGEFIYTAADTAHEIINSHGEVCETYKDAQRFLSDLAKLSDKYKAEIEEGETSDYDDEVEELEKDFLKDLLEDYRIMAKHQYEHEQSEEHVLELIEANDYLFDEEGDLLPITTYWNNNTIVKKTFGKYDITAIN